MNRDFGVQGKEAWRRAAKRKGFPAKMKKLGSSWRFFFFFFFSYSQSDKITCDPRDILA